MDYNQSENEISFNCTLPRDITENQWNFYYAFVWIVEGVSSVLVGCFGICFNFMTIGVVLSSELSTCFFNWLLVSLCVFDSFFLLCGILEAFRSHLGSTNIHKYIFVVFLYPFRSVVMFCSIYTTMMLALERYNALTKPLANQVSAAQPGRQTLMAHFRIHSLRLLKYIGPIVMASVIFYIPRQFELEIKSENGSYNNEYEITVNALRNNNHYNLWYLNISNFLVTIVIPLVTLIYLNANIYIKFKEFLQRQPSMRTASSNDTNYRITHKRDKDTIQQTKVLFSVAIMFGMFHFLRMILNVEELLTLEIRRMARNKGCEWLQYWTIISAPVSHLLLQINSSINVFIYCYFNKLFRDRLSFWFASIQNFLKIKRDLEEETNENGHTAERNQQLQPQIESEMEGIVLAEEIIDETVSQSYITENLSRNKNSEFPTHV